MTRIAIVCSFMQPGDVGDRITLTDVDIRAMHGGDGHEDGDVLLLHAYTLPLTCLLQGVGVVTTRAHAASNLLASRELPAPPAPCSSGERVRQLSASDTVGDMIGDMLRVMTRPSSSTIPELMLLDYTTLVV